MIESTPMRNNLQLKEFIWSMILNELNKYISNDNISDVFEYLTHTW
jgi:hypothetical protein